MGRYTAEEREAIRRAMERLRQAEEEMKSGELRGGIIPLIPLLIGLASAAARVLPRVIGAVARVGARGLTSAARVGARGLAQTGRTGMNIARQAAQKVGRTATKRPATTMRSGPIEKAASRSLIKKTGLALGTVGMAGIGGMSDEPIDEDVVEELNPLGLAEVAPIPPRQDTPGTELPVGDIAEDNVDEEVEGEETYKPFNIAPIRYNPRLRNVYTVGESRNPLQTGQYSSLLLSRRTTGQTSSRDISRLTGLGKQTYRMRVLKKYGLEDRPYNLTELAKITGVPKKTLQEVYNRGTGAYETNPTSVRMKGSFKKNVDAPMSQKLSKEQWSMARVYSFLAGNKKHDNDLR